MIYTVVWMPDALNALASTWTAAANKTAVTRASNLIDQKLGISPHQLGVLIFDIVREYVEPPLGVEFQVDDGNMIVSVLLVWDVSMGRPPLSGN